MRKVRDIILICLVGCVQNCANFDANGGYLGVLLVSGGASGGAGSAVPADWWDTSWKKRRRMTIDNSSRGALSDVPVLVQLTSARIDYTSAAADGSDVCFVVAGSSAGSAALSHEIEQWNSSGTSILWLKVPSLAAAASVSIDMYYEGSTCATTASDAWNSNYQTVWHLNTAVTDSSGRANDLVATGATQTTAGLFAGASSFGGTGDQLEDADGENYLNGQTALSFSAWVQATATGSDMGFFYAASPLVRTMCPVCVTTLPVPAVPAPFVLRGRSTWPVRSYKWKPLLRSRVRAGRT